MKPEYDVVLSFRFQELQLNPSEKKAHYMGHIKGENNSSDVARMEA